MRVVAVCGSLQTNSINLELINIIKECLKHNLKILDRELLNLPFFHTEHFSNSDVRHKLAQSKLALGSAEIILIASPEYNGSVSAPIKNFIDWLSVDIGDGLGKNPFRNKKISIVSASPGYFGGMRAAVHMRDIMFHLGGLLFPQILCISTKNFPVNSQENLSLIKDFATLLA